MTRFETILCLTMIAVVVVLGFAIVRPVSASSYRAGQASWYCCTRGYASSAYVAAAGASLRVGAWRGRHVRVCRVDRPSCLYVRLVDACACGVRGRIIDLHSGAFRRLAPLSAGVVRVRVTW